MTKRNARRKAEQNGHQLGNFKARVFSATFGRTTEKMYDVAHCRRCQAACFANEPATATDVNPALQRRCEGN
jgi:hypothetical protein